MIKSTLWIAEELAYTALTNSGVLKIITSITSCVDSYFYLNQEINPVMAIILTYKYVIQNMDVEWLQRSAFVMTDTDLPHEFIFVSPIFFFYLSVIMLLQNTL